MGTTECPRDALRRLADARGVSLAALSRMLGRNPAYAQQFVARGTPARLDERDRRRLADFFGVAEAVLGAPEPRRIVVPRLGVVASAGPGAEVVGEEAVGRLELAPEWMVALAGASGGHLSTIRVHGDSMWPTLADGDELLVDEGAQPLRAGVYVVRLDDALLVKRLKPGPGGATVSVVSDNEAYPTLPDLPAGEVAVVGRVIWVGRRV